MRLEPASFSVPFCGFEPSFSFAEASLTRARLGGLDERIHGFVGLKARAPLRP